MTYCTRLSVVVSNFIRLLDTGYLKVSIIHHIPVHTNVCQTYENRAVRLVNSSKRHARRVGAGKNSTGISAGTPVAGVGIALKVGNGGAEEKSNMKHDKHQLHFHYFTISLFHYFIIQLTLLILHGQPLNKMLGQLSLPETVTVKKKVNTYTRRIDQKFLI